MPARLTKRMKEKFILTEAKSQSEGRKAPSDPKPAVRKRNRSSSSHPDNPSLQQLQPADKKARLVSEKILCTQCSLEFNEGEFRRHNKIAHNLKCSYDDCSLMFVDVSSLSHHLKSHQGEDEGQHPQSPGKIGKARVACLKDDGKSPLAAGSNRDKRKTRESSPVQSSDSPRFDGSLNTEKFQQEEKIGARRRRRSTSRKERDEYSDASLMITRRSLRRKSFSGMLMNLAAKEKAVPAPTITGRSLPRNSFSGRDYLSPPPQSPKRTKKSPEIISDELWTPQSAKKKRRSSARKAETVVKSTSTGGGRQRSLSGLSLLEVSEYWRCGLCHEVLSSQPRLEAHLEKPHLHQCQVEENCQRSFRTISDRLRHHYEAHNVNKQLTECSVCLEMIDTKSRKNHDMRSHDLACTEDGCPVKSNAEGIWVHRIKKHNYGRCMNQPAADPGEDEVMMDNLTEPDDTPEKHFETSSLDHGVEKVDEEVPDASPVPEAHGVDVDVMEEPVENIPTCFVDLGKENDDEDAGSRLSLVPAKELNGSEVEELAAQKENVQDLAGEVEMLGENCQQPSQDSNSTFKVREKAEHNKDVSEFSKHTLFTKENLDEGEEVLLTPGQEGLAEASKLDQEEEQEEDDQDQDETPVESLLEEFPLLPFQRCSQCEVLVPTRKFSRHCKRLHKFPCEEPQCSLHFATQKDQLQHRFMVHDTRKEVELAGFRVCPDCREVFSEKEQQQFSLHLKMDDHLTCSRCERKFGCHNRDLYQFHSEFEHCECYDQVCPKKCYKNCHPQADCDCFIELFNLMKEEGCGLGAHEDDQDKSVEESFHTEAATPPKSVRREVSLDENLRDSISISQSPPEAGQKLKSVRKEKLIKLNRSEKQPISSSVSICGRPFRKRNKKLLKDNWKWVEGPKEDEYNADDEENEVAVETVIDEERNPIIVIDADEGALEEEGRPEAADNPDQPKLRVRNDGKLDVGEEEDDIDALLGDSSDEEEVKQKTSIAIQPVFPMVILKTPRQSFKCPKCRLDFKKEKEFISHQNSRHSFKCEFCPLQFNYANGLSDHVNKEHQEEVNPGVGSRALTCHLCQRAVKREILLLSHLKMDHDFPCPECRLKFTGEVFLKEHLLKSHQIKPSSVRKSRRSSSEKSRKSKKKDLSSKESDQIRSRSKASKREKSKSKSKSAANLPAKDSVEDDDSVCAQCQKLFQETEDFEAHINLNHHHHCPDTMCELSFTTESLLQLHLYEAHGFGTKPTPVEAASIISTNYEDPAQLELDCTTSGQEKQGQDKLHYTPEKLLSSQSIPVKKKSRKPKFCCYKCKKEFNSKELRSQHSAEIHVFSCDNQGCLRSYISQPELTRHTARCKHGQAADSELAGVVCTDCGDKFPDLESLESHQLQPHGFTCHVVACSSKFETKPKLLQHLEDQHNIKHVKIDDQNSGFITTQRSPDNVQIAEWALEWIK